MTLVLAEQVQHGLNNFITVIEHIDWLKETTASNITTTMEAAETCETSENLYKSVKYYIALDSNIQHQSC
jgi:hypothetical protein